MKFLPTLLALIFLTSLLPAEAGTSGRETHLLRLLKSLPEDATPYHRVAALTSHLTKLSPQKAFGYFKIAIRRLSNEGGIKAGNTTRLEFVLAKIVKKSDLTPQQIARIIKQITFTELCYCPPPDPGPTPDPTP